MFEKIKERREKKKEEKKARELEANKKLEELQEKDEIAKKVSWEFLSEEGLSIKTHRVMNYRNRNTVEVEYIDGVTNILDLLCLGCSIFLIGILFWSMIGESLETARETFYYLLIILVSTFLYIFSIFHRNKNKVFDKEYEVFYEGYPKLEKLKKKRKGILFKEMYAIQIIPKVIEGSYNYEINLVLKNADRINLLTNISKQDTLYDMRIFSTSLKLSIWDQLIDYYE